MHTKVHRNPETLNRLFLPAKPNYGLTLAVAMLPGILFSIGANAENHDRKKPPVTIEASESLEWDQKEGSYTAKGNAYIVQGESKIKADLIIAHYTPNGKTRDLTRVIATGSVVYNNAENLAQGETLDYDITTNRYLLKGANVRASGPEGEMTANKSIIYDENNINKQILTAVGKARYKNNDGRTLYGDQLVAVLDSNGTLISIDGFGNTMVVSTEGTTANADKLNYLAETSLAKLNGNVVINDKENVMRGARAEIDFGKDISRIISDGKGKRVSGVLTP